MSMDRCACGTIVDTDEGECYGEDGKLPATCSACLDAIARQCVDCGQEVCAPGCPSRLP